MNRIEKQPSTTRLRYARKRQQSDHGRWICDEWLMINCGTHTIRINGKQILTMRNDTCAVDMFRRRCSCSDTVLRCPPSLGGHVPRGRQDMYASSIRHDYNMVRAKRLLAWWDCSRKYSRGSDLLQVVFWSNCGTSSLVVVQSAQICRDAAGGRVERRQRY